MKNIVAVYKPRGPTSHDIVNQIRKITGEKRVGHAGTLDPLASGVLVVGIGREATKQLHTIVAKEKEYLATIKLGFESTTDDEEGEKKSFEIISMPSRSSIEKALRQFIGEISQTPPIYSAVKIRGKSSYKYARQGKDFTLEPRKVVIKDIELLDYTWPILKLKITTGPGAYIRALARDIGRTLKTGGYLVELERTRVGEFTKRQAVRIEDLGKKVNTNYQT